LGKSDAQLPSETAAKPLVLAASKAIAMPSTANVGPAHIDRIWERMAGIFGHKWTSSYGAEPSDTWLAGLIDMSEEELRTGLVACLTWPEEWPPTLPQFRQLCRPRREEAHRIYRAALPEPPEVRARRKAAGVAALQGIRDGLARREVAE
jgi:hypothetical protein